MTVIMHTCHFEQDSKINVIYQQSRNAWQEKYSVYIYSGIMKQELFWVHAGHRYIPPSVYNCIARSITHRVSCICIYNTLLVPFVHHVVCMLCD